MLEHRIKTIKKFKVIETIPVGEEITLYSIVTNYEQDSNKMITVNLIKYKNKLGSIAKITNSEEDNPTPTKETPTVTPTPEPTKEPGEAIKSDKPDTMIIICIIVSVIVGFIAIVAAVSINKKTKKQKENTVEPKNKDTVAKPTEEQNKETEPTKKEE